MEYIVSTVMEKEEFHLTKEEAERYLRIYLGESDWKKHLLILFDRLKKQNGEEQAKIIIKKMIAFSILLPTFDRSKITDPPENLLFGGFKYTQFNEKDWTDLLRIEVKKDKEIALNRSKCLSLGFVDPIEYSPITRQAFNWLYGKADDLGVINADNKNQMIKIFKNLVVAYGGKVVCDVFIKEDWKINKKILNWRSNYFFEKLIYETYTPEQIFKIKKQELAKTNTRLVKSVRTD